MNDNKEVTFKTVLYVDDKLVAESYDLTLWQNVLSSIKTNTISPLIPTNDIVKETPDSQKNDNNGIQNFSKEVEIEADMIVDACNPTIESPYIKLDMKTWENYKRKHFKNKRPLPDVVIVGTILALWKKSANLGDATHKEVINVLKQLNISPSNPSRSYKNCEWLKHENGKITLMATKYSLAQKMLLEYCQSM